ncbi:MAG: hypothetical protein RLZZ488_2670 [Pseudomonadota bacterium]|jgi:hypothetical protein
MRVRVADKSAVFLLIAACFSGSSVGVCAEVSSARSSPSLRENLSLQESGQREKAVDQQLLLSSRAFIAARRYEDALKVWFLKNTLTSVRGSAPVQESTVASAAWLAMARLKVCPEDMPQDAHGLWTVAVHNLILNSLFRGQPAPPVSPFAAFSSGRQERKISARDVLSPEELNTLKFPEGSCSVINILSRGGMDYFNYLLEETQLARPQAAKLMIDVLNKASSEMRDVQGIPVLQARIFDLHLFLMGRSELTEESEKILADAEEWTVADWMALPSSRRLFLFEKVFAGSSDRVSDRRKIIPILDALIDQQVGSELSNWIGLYSVDASPAELREIWSGERGSRLLSLDKQSGFLGRPAIALRRGLAALENGDVHNALKNLGLAINYSGQEEGDDSVASQLARRWISYISGTWRVTPDLVAVLKEVLPKDAYSVIFEDLAWRAALRSDVRSFERLMTLLRMRSAAAIRVEQLLLLAKGEVKEFARRLMRRLEEEPYSTLRFTGLLLDRIESEDTQVRTRMAPILQKLSDLQDGSGKIKGRVGENLQKLSKRAHEILRVLSTDSASSMATKARGYNPQDGVFVGHVRVAPTDPLPWPYAAPKPSSPQPFAPILVVPEQWSAGESLVLGWKIVE